jgi:hypothetical protein
VVGHIGQQSKEISGKDQIARVATISAGDDPSARAKPSMKNLG